MKPYERYVNSLINDDDPDIREIGNEAKRRAWTLEFIAECNTEDEQDVKKVFEENAGASYEFFFEDMSLAEVVRNGYISLYERHMAYWIDSL